MATAGSPPIAMLIHEMGNHDLHTCGRPGSTVPLLFDVSGVPSPFLLLSGSLAMSVECFVSVLEMPSCFPEMVVIGSPGVLADAACSQERSTIAETSATNS